MQWDSVAISKRKNNSQFYWLLRFPCLIFFGYSLGCGDVENQQTNDLRDAILNNDLHLAESSLTQKAKINGFYCLDWDACDVSNWLKAAEIGSLEMLQLLASHGADVNELSNYDTTALSIAVRKRDKIRIKRLLELGANPEKRLSDGRPLLHHMMCNNIEDSQILLFLLDSGAKVDAYDKEGSTPIFDAVSCERKSFVNILLSKSADVNHENRFGVNPLAVALHRGKSQLASILKKKGAVIPRSPDGRLFVGIALSDTALVKEAIKNGAKINEQGYRETKTPLIEAAQRGNPEIIQILLSAGAAINKQSSFGTTPLIAAAEEGHLRVTKILLEAGADKNIKDNWGGTALSRADQYNRLEIAALLRE